MTNYKLIIEYDGTAYHGWQRQKTDSTIQQKIEAAISTMAKEKINLIGSGRTDAGVHALAQAANFHTSSNIPSNAFVAGLNSLLPDDIVIKSCEPVDENFHSRFGAKSKTYQYRILNERLPSAINRNYAWFIRAPLEVSLMQAALTHIIGEHDFKSFEGAGSPRASTIRTVFKTEFKTKDNYIIFDITANGFLRYMIRNLIGTFVDVGHKKTSPDQFKKILTSKNRALAGNTAPPHGLFLLHVTYE